MTFWTILLSNDWRSVYDFIVRFKSGFVLFVWRYSTNYALLTRYNEMKNRFTLFIDDAI